MVDYQRILGSVAPTEDSGSSGTVSHDRLDGRRSDEVRSIGMAPCCTVPASLPDGRFRSPSATPVSSPATVQSIVNLCGLPRQWA